MTDCVCGCGQRAVHAHHVVTRQELRKHHGDADDPRNLVPVHVLPTQVFDFACDVMGPGAAYEYLARTYAGTDVRLERLLDEDLTA